METSPWNDSLFCYPKKVPCMITDEEKIYLYWLASEEWSGEGHVVEIGPWLGGSTICLANGMRDSGRFVKSMLKVYDNFVWRDFMSERASLPLTAGESFYPYFLKNTNAYAEIIDSYICGLPDEVISGDLEARAKRFIESDSIRLFDYEFERPVEILFIDGAKSWNGLRYLAFKLNEHFMPGKTLLVCQDFKYWGTYWVPIFMMLVRDCIEPVHNVLGSTTVSFRLTKRFSNDLLASLETHIGDFSRDVALRQIAIATDMLHDLGDSEGSHNVRLAQVSFLAHCGETALASSAFQASERQWPFCVGTPQLERARQYLRKEKGVRRRRSMRLRLSSSVRRLGLT